MRYGNLEVAEQVAEEVRQNNPGHIAVKVLSDGSIAMLHDLLFTRAIHLGCNAWGWSRRFCFEDRELAARAFDKLTSEEDEPAGCVARRG